MHGILVFTSLRDAMHAGYHVVGRIANGYAVAIRTPDGWALAIVDLRRAA
jgi:hypothetical protein